MGHGNGVTACFNAIFSSVKYYSLHTHL